MDEGTPAAVNEPIRSLLTDSFDRIAGLVQELTDGLTDESAQFRVDPAANTVAWLLWHAIRVQDDHVADLAESGQVWDAGWRDRFALDLPADDTGYGHSAEQVALVRASAENLAGYHAEVHTATLEYVRRVDVDELARVVDTRWDPPVTASARLVSVIGDCLQHLGQAAFVRGVADRSDGGSG